MAILAADNRRRNANQFATSAEIARICGVSFMTVNRACDAGDVEYHRTAGKHRRINVQSACEFFGVPVPEGMGNVKAEIETGKIVAAYARCSTQKQSDNLKRQVERLEKYVAENYAGCESKTFAEIGSGINNEREQLLRLLDYVLAGRVSVVVCEFGDRLSRSARSLIVRICEKCGVEVVETRQGEQEFDAQSDAEEMLKDCMMYMTVFAAKQNGKRAGEKTRFVASPELKTRITTLLAEGKSCKAIGQIVIKEGHRCLNTDRVVGKWSVNRIIGDIRADLAKTETQTVAAPKSVSQFVKRFCVVSRAKHVYGAAMYQTYRAFCEREGVEVLNNQQFAKTLRGMGFKHVREAKGYSTVYGLALKHNPAASKNRKTFKVILPQ